MPFEWMNSNPKTMHPTMNSKLVSVDTCLFFVEELIEAEMVSQISSSEVLHSHVEIFPILEGGFHVDDEWIGDLLKYGLLVDDRTNTLFQ